MHFGGNDSDYSSDASSIDISHLVDQHVAAQQQQQQQPPTELSPPTTAAAETLVGNADNGQDDGEKITYKAQHHHVAETTTTSPEDAEEKQPVAADEKDTAKEPRLDDTNNNNDNGNMIRIIMGKSVQAWRQRKNKTKASLNHLNLNLQHVILRHGTDATLPNLESSRLETDKHVAHISNDKTQQHHTGRLRMMTGGGPLSSSGLVECVAIWDAIRDCHVLEIVNAVVTDLVVKGDDNNAAAADSTAATASMPTHKNPVEQLRQAEKTLVRKRRAASKANTSMRAASSKKVAKTNNEKK